MSNQIPNIEADEEAISKLAIANVKFGQTLERERIIKLLWDNLHDWTSGIHLLNLEVASIDDLEALIKGEK